MMASQLYQGADNSRAEKVGLLLWRLELDAAKAGATKADLAWVVTCWFSAIIHMQGLDQDQAVADVAKGIRHGLADIDRKLAEQPNMTTH